MPTRTLQVVILGDSASAQRAFEKTGAAAVAASKEAEKSATSFEKAGARMSTFGGNVEKVGKTLSTHLTLPIVAVGAVAAKSAAEFDRSMLLIHTSAGATKSEVKDLTKYIEKLGTVAPQSLGELSDAAYRIVGGGIHGNATKKALKESVDFAVMQGTQVEETAKSVTQVAFANMAGANENFKKIVAGLNATVGAGDLRASDLIDALGTGLPAAAKAAGLSFQDMDAALAVIGDNTTNVSGGAAQLSTAFHYLYDPTEKAVGALEQMGLTQTSLAEDLKKPHGLYVALADLRSSLEGLPGGRKGVQAEQLLGEILPGGKGRILLTFLNELERVKEKEEEIGKTSAPKRFEKSVKEAYEQPAVEAEVALNQLKTAVTGFGQDILPIAMPVLKEAGEIVDGISNDFEKLPKSTQGFIIKAGLAVAALGPMLTIGGNILKVFGAVEATVGKIGQGLGVLQAEQAVSGVAGGGGVVPVGAGAKGVAAEATAAEAAAAGTTAAESAVPRWLGTESTNPVFGSFLWAGPGGGRALQKAGRETVRAPMLPISEANATTDALGLERAGTPALASSFAGMGSRLAKGALTWGLGGVLVGQMVKEVGSSKTATDIGDALQGAGVGAAIGTAIAPGIGTAIGAALGGAGGAIVGILGNEEGQQEKGEKYGEAFLKGWQKNIPHLRRLERQGFIGEAAHKERIGAAQEGGVSVGVGGKRIVHAEATGFAYRSGSGLKGEKSVLEDRLDNTKLNEKEKLVIQEEIQAVDKAIRNIQNARKYFSATVKGMQGDAALGMAAINRDFVSGMSEADSAWGKGTKAWRPHVVEAMQGSVHAIESGMNAGVINVQVGEKRINELLARMHLVKGDDPFGLAKATADSFKKAGGYTHAGVEKWKSELKQMPPAAAKSSIESTNQMLQAWAQGHPKIEAQIKTLTAFEIKHFGATNKQLREGVKKGATGPVAEAFVEAAQGVGGALGNIGTNTNAMLKALGLHDMVQFQAIVFGPSRMGSTTLNKEGGGGVAAGEAMHHHRAGGGSVRVPGQGLYDTVPLSVNGKMSAVVAPGEDLVVFNRHQRPLIDQAVANEYGVAGLPGFFNTFNREHYKASGGSVHVNGPRSTGNIGQGVISKTAKAVNAFFKAHEPKHNAAGAGAFTGTTAPGVGSFQGFPVDKWIIPELEYAVAHGWTGHITSGYRTPAHSAELGFPNDEHTKTSYPGGAVDFGGMHEAAASANRAAFIAATAGYKGPKLRLPVGFVDDGHMSGTGHARGGHVALHGPPLFHGEGPQYYGAALRHNQPWATHQAPWSTRLSATQEKAFLSWGRDIDGKGHGLGWFGFDPHRQRNDYDMRGYWLRSRANGLHSDGHFTDEWKTPYDTAFSRWSTYAKPDTPFDWRDGYLVDIRNGQEILSGKFAAGGLVGALRKKAAQVWKVAAPLYGRSPGSMPPNLSGGRFRHPQEAETLHAGLDGAKRDVVKFGPGLIKAFVSGKSNLRNTADETLLHEWVHYFQNFNKLKKPWEWEGGAEAFARHNAPGVYKALGWPYANPAYSGYPKFEQDVIKTKGWPWVSNGQFKARGGPVGLQKGGSAEGTTPALNRFLAKTWNRAAPLYGRSPKSAYPGGDYLARGLTGTEGDVGKVEGSPGHKAVFFDSGWMKQAMAGGHYGLGALLHEWAHVFQKPGLSRWEREGGATDFSRYAAPQVFGFDETRWPSKGYEGFAERVKSQLGDQWIRKGQFNAKGGSIPGFSSGGVVGTVGSILQRNGLDPVASAAILGSSYGESSWNPASVGSGGGGLWGFTTPPISLANLQEFASSQGKPWTSAEVQTQFLLHNLPSSMRAAMNKMSSVSEATTYFVENWEHPETLASLPTRIQAGEKALAMLGGAKGTTGTGGKPSKQSVIEGSKNYAKGHTHAGGTSAGFAPHKEIQAALKAGAAHAKNPTISHGVGVSKLPSWAAGLPLFQREELEGRGTTLPERQTILGNAETNAAFEAGVAGSALEKARAAYGKNPSAKTWGAVGKASSLAQVKRKAQTAAAMAKKLFEKGYIGHLTRQIKKINAELSNAGGKMTMKQVAALQAKRAELVSLRASARGESQGAMESLKGYEQAGEAEASELESESPLGMAAAGISEANWSELTWPGETTPKEVEEALERPWKEAEAELALAGLTESTADDLAALEKEKAIANEKLEAAKSSGDLEGEIQWAGTLKGVEESIKGLNEGGSQGSMQTAIEELTKTLKQQTQFAESATATNSATAWKALADIMSGNLGPRANLAAQTAGNGSVGTF